MKNLYHILGVVPTADDAAIRAAAKALAIKYHPDRAHASRKAQYEERFKEIQEAKLVLCDPDRRRRYDIELWSRTQPVTMPHPGRAAAPQPPPQASRSPWPNMAPDPAQAFREQAEKIVRNASRHFANAATDLFNQFVGNLTDETTHYQRRDPFTGNKRRRG